MNLILLDVIGEQVAESHIPLATGLLAALSTSDELSAVATGAVVLIAREVTALILAWLRRRFSHRTRSVQMPLNFDSIPSEKHKPKDKNTK